MTWRHRGPQRFRTMPRPTTDCVTFGSPMYASFPIPEIFTSSESLAWTTPLPTPLIVTCVARLQGTGTGKRPTWVSVKLARYRNPAFSRTVVMLATCWPVAS